MKKIKNFFSNNKVFILIMSLGFILLLIQMNQVVLYADDFSLGIYSKTSSFQDILDYQVNHYKSWGGGYTGFIVILILKLGINFWKIINTILIFLIVLLATKMITYKSNKNRNIIATLLWLSVFFLGIYTSRECIYWLDGSLAYVLSTFELFIFIYAIYSKLIMKTKIKKFDYILLPFFGLFSGWSSAQTGIVALFIALLIILWSKIINKEKIKPIIWISCLFCIIGCLIFYLSPGNFGRMGEFQEYSNLNIVEKILYRADGVYSLMFDFKRYQTSGMPFYTILMLGLVSIIGIQFASKEKNKKIKILISLASIVITLFLLILLLISFNIPSIELIQQKVFTFNNLYTKLNERTLYLVDLFPYILTSIIMILSLIVSIYISKKEKNPLLLITLLCGYLTQGIMVMAPYSPLRTTLTSIIFFIIVIGYLCYIGLKNKNSLLLAFVISLAIYNFYIGSLLVLLYICISNLKLEETDFDKEIITILLIFSMTSLINLYQVYSGYKTNKEIYNRNITRIEEFLKNYPTKEEQKNKELTLLLPEDEKYGFTAMVGIDWIDDAIKNYFEIDSSVELIGETIEKDN